MKKKVKRKPPTRRLLPEPPPKQPEEVERLLSADDFEELAYRRMAELRQRKQRTPEQSKALAEHDAIERQIEKDPKDVLRDEIKMLQFARECSGPRCAGHRAVDDTI